LFAGISASFFLFSKETAVISVLFLTISDPLAAIVGKWIGKTSIFDKTVEGSAGFFISSVIIIFLFSGVSFTMVTVAFIVTIIEALPLKINDNILIPLTAGYLITIM